VKAETRSPTAHEDTVTENTEAAPGDAFEERDESPADMLAAWSKGASAITFERVGGGRGPGWSGDTYLGHAIQLGFAGEFKGTTLQEVLQRAMDACGGGRYRWRARTSKGKWHEDEIYFPGEPKPLPGTTDPAAQAQAAGGYAAFGGGYPAGGFAPQGAGFAPQGGGAFAAGRLTAGWNWSHAKQSWFWVDDDGQISDPPFGMRPPAAPGAGAFLPGGFFHPQQGQASPEVAALKEQLARLEGKLESKAAGGGGDLMAGFLGLMKYQADQSIANAKAERESAERRSADERAARDREAAAQRETWKEQQALLARFTAAPAAAADPMKIIRESIDLHQKIGETFGGGKTKEPETTTAERIGEKVIDALTNFAELGKTWIDRDKKEGGGDKKKKDAPPKNGNGNGSTSSTSDDGLDEDLRRWLTLLDVAAEAYEARRSPSTAFDMLYSACKAAKIDFDSVALALKTLTAKQLLSLLADQPEPVSSRSKPILAAFSTGDGQAWFQKLIEHARSARIEPKAEG
jgi:hypothetical protein